MDPWIVQRALAHSTALLPSTQRHGWGTTTTAVTVCCHEGCALLDLEHAVAERTLTERRTFSSSTMTTECSMSAGHQI